MRKGSRSRSASGTGGPATSASTSATSAARRRSWAGARRRASPTGRADCGTGLTRTPDASRVERPRRLHAVVRPRARRRARARRRRRRAGDLAFSFRRLLVLRGRLPPERALLPGLVAALPALAPARPPQAARAPGRDRGAAREAPRRPPRPVVRRRAPRPVALPRSPAAGLHRARPASAADGGPRAALARPVCPLRPDRRAQRARPRDAGGL